MIKTYLFKLFYGNKFINITSLVLFTIVHQFCDTFIQVEIGAEESFGIDLYSSLTTSLVLGFLIMSLVLILTKIYPKTFYYILNTSKEDFQKNLNKIFPLLLIILILIDNAYLFYRAPFNSALIIFLSIVLSVCYIGKLVHSIALIYILINYVNRRNTKFV